MGVEGSWGRLWGCLSPRGLHACGWLQSLLLAQNPSGRR